MTLRDDDLNQGNTAVLDLSISSQFRHDLRNLGSLPNGRTPDRLFVHGQAHGLPGQEGVRRYTEVR